MGIKRTDVVMCILETKRGVNNRLLDLMLNQLLRVLERHHNKSQGKVLRNTVIIIYNYKNNDCGNEMKTELEIKSVKSF